MKRTAIAFTEIGGKLKFIATITCECTGEMSDHTKVWTEVNDSSSKWYSLHRANGKHYRYYYFILEGV